MPSRSMLPLLLLVAVTVLWGYTFVTVQDAVAVYPLFAFLCVRFAISTAVLAPFAWRPLRRLPLRGWVTGAGVGSVLAIAYALQTAGLHLGTVSSAGLITGLYVVFTPLITLTLFGTRVPAAAWLGIGISLAGLALLSGVPGGSLSANALLLGNAIAQSFQIASMERFAPRYDARALTFLQMAVCCSGFTVIALALGQLETPHGGTVWSALVVTGVFAGALGYLVATWVQARTTAARAALVFMLEAPFAAFFGVLLAGDRLGWIGWSGCGLMLVGIVIAEPAAGDALQRILPGRVRPVERRPLWRSLRRSAAGG
jgi:drug/metabolite transporter (DMT)-like permease